MKRINIDTLRRLMKENHVTQARVAVLMKCGAPNVCQQLNGLRKITADDISAYAAALDMTPGDLLNSICE